MTALSGDVYPSLSERRWKAAEAVGETAGGNVFHQRRDKIKNYNLLARNAKMPEIK